MHTICHLLLLIAVLFVPAAAAQEAAERYIVDEGAAPISAIEVYAPIGPDSAVVVDCTHALFPVLSNRSNRTVGKLDAGPCARREVTSYAVAGDTVLVLDRSFGPVADMPSFTAGRVLYSLVATEFVTKSYDIREVKLPEAR